jgi:GTP-binding protein Era
MVATSTTVLARQPCSVNAAEPIKIIRTIARMAALLAPKIGAADCRQVNSRGRRSVSPSSQVDHSAVVPRSQVSVPEPKLLILNKVDLVKKEALLTLITQFDGRADFEQIYMISASTGDGVEELKAALAARVPEGPWHFPEDQVSDATDRMMAAEITREQLYHQLHEELPYQSAVETEQYKERPDGSVEIHQQILVARPTQRGIILGKGGQRLKEIGSKARAELSALMGVQVHLYLHVKVKEGWDEDRHVYRDLGLDWVE